MITHISKPCLRTSGRESSSRLEGSPLMSFLHGIFFIIIYEKYTLNFKEKWRKKVLTSPLLSHFAPQYMYYHTNVLIISFYYTIKLKISYHYIRVIQKLMTFHALQRRRSFPNPYSRLTG